MTPVVGIFSLAQLQCWHASFSSPVSLVFVSVLVILSAAVYDRPTVQSFFTTKIDILVVNISASNWSLSLGLTSGCLRL